MQKYGQKWRFFGEQKARYALFSISGLLIFIMLVTHDGALYSAMERGDADASAMEELFFNWSHEQDTQILRAASIGLIILIGYAIVIKIAQWKLARISYSV